MPLIQWNDRFSVKIDEIDRQHQQLVTIINELYDAMKQGKGKDVLSGIIRNLIHYTKIHFQTEEKYFAKFNYPETAQHKREHDAFVDKVSDFKQDFEDGKLSVTISIMNFLSEWLQKHIKGSDQKYAKFFQENGLK